MAGSTNILQWNPNATNVETDSQYNSDSQRQNGAVDGQEFLSVTANKLFQQMTWMVAALAQSLANKGFTVSDSNYQNLVAMFSNMLTTADVPSPFQEIAFSSSGPLTFNAAGGGNRTWRVDLSANVTSMSLINSTPGQSFTFQFVQDGVGGRTITGVGAQFLGWGNISQGPNSITTQTFTVLDSQNNLGATSESIVPRE